MVTDHKRIQSLAIIGAKGQMGKLIADGCERIGVAVAGLDQPLLRKDLAAALPGADAVLLCVPVTAFEEVLRVIAPHLRPETILTDLCSVKEIPVKHMLRAHSGPVVGTHPLFGPVIPEGFEPRVAVTPGRGENAPAAISDLLKRLGYVPFDSTVEEHDRAMAWVQSLNFATTVAYLSAMRAEPGIDNFVTPSLHRRLDAARKMLTKDREMFAAITENNPYIQETVRSFGSYLSIAAGGDLDLLAGLACRWWRDEEEGGG